MKKGDKSFIVSCIIPKPRIVERDALGAQNNFIAKSNDVQIFGRIDATP